MNACGLLRAASMAAYDPVCYFAYMAVRHYTFNLTTTAQELVGLNDTESQRRGVTIIFNTDKQNNDVAMIGGPGVTNTNFGIHLDADESYTLSGEYTWKDKFYGIAKTTTAVLHVLVIGG
jgi:hypothetical protein